MHKLPRHPEYIDAGEGAASSKWEKLKRSVKIGELTHKAEVTMVSHIPSPK